jgi:hypothetical protein
MSLYLRLIYLGAPTNFIGVPHSVIGLSPFYERLNAHKRLAKGG